MIKNVISVIDGEAGSCGKAKVVGEIATLEGINLGAAVTNCMPNAGHTFVDENGNKTVFRNIPVSIVNPNTELFIGPGSAIDMEIFKEEYEHAQKYLQDRKIYVHELVPLIEERHKEREKETIKSGSTFKGCWAVNSEKSGRDSKVQFFKTYKNAICVSNEEWLDRLYKHLDNSNEYIILEGAQGCDLDLNHSGNYPHVTSRSVSTTDLLDDSGISAQRLLQTIMVIRPFPIRINNITNDGKFIYTGAYGKGAELTWTQINLASMFSEYPFKGDIYNYVNHLKERQKELRRVISRCPEIYLRQALGEAYKSRKLDSITLLEALELERLMYKSKGYTSYQTRFIEVPMVDSDFPENTIFDKSEQTTVTKMERRVFDLDIAKLKSNCRINTPSCLYLNFFEHLSSDYHGQTGAYEDFYFHSYLREYLSWLEYETGVPILALGTGKRNGERILKRSLVKDIRID